EGAQAMSRCIARSTSPIAILSRHASAMASISTYPVRTVAPGGTTIERSSGTWTACTGDLSYGGSLPAFHRARRDLRRAAGGLFGGLQQERHRGLYALLGNHEICGVALYADEVSASVYAGNSGRAGAHRVVKHRVAGVGISA